MSAKPAPGAAKPPRPGHVRSVPDAKTLPPPETEETGLAIIVPRPGQEGFEEIRDEKFEALLDLAAQFVAAQRAAKEAKAVADVAQERILAELAGRDTIQIGPWRICRADGKPKVTVTEVAQ